MRDNNPQLPSAAIVLHAFAPENSVIVLEKQTGLLPPGTIEVNLGAHPRVSFQIGKRKDKESADLEIQS